MEYSKRLISDIRSLLWVITVGGLGLAFYCIYKEFLGELPWIALMVSSAWAAHGTACGFYFSMAKSDHKKGGITYDAAAADNFGVEESFSSENPE